MKLFFAFLLLTVGLAQADGPDVKSSPSQPQAIVIPAGAVAAAPYLYSYIDKDGRKWFYRETPFGVMRYPDEPAAAPKNPQPDGIRAFEDGDVVRFERLGPFGIYHWTKNKLSLDPDEQAALDRERAGITAKRY